MCRADPREASVVHERFNNYYNWSSQQANREKSNIFFSATTSQKDKKAIKEILGFKDMGSKELGGLRFRKFEDMNLAMLAKLGWKLASGEDYLWTKIIKARYLQNDTFLNYKLKKGDSREHMGERKQCKLEKALEA
ncbi:hypothetical protein FEM48_Zijuj04G0090100 [Ziziphus jujuba var. spinosa]|uniref:Uncharacterized protein n=1 Tax=Ziziphus jujuba var. spinosa TaxID=714518 RepID=A0A978VIZ4_ZIZJJ|nr:hypothetical protein FEM48_Zijuj04G0090100 [Ziziphus jujuba var. spinosa]